MATNTTYLITGGNRGIGLGLVTKYLSIPNSTVIAGVRNPSDGPSKALLALPVAKNSSLIIVTIESTSKESAVLAAVQLQTKHGIDHLDVVIANAGISYIWPKVVDAEVKDMEKHYSVNVIGVVLLFQAMRPMIEKSERGKFITMSSSGGSITQTDTLLVPNAAYGQTKAALNFITKKIHHEHPTILTFPIDPGWVQTDMGNTAAQYFGIEQADITLEESVNGMVKVIDEATKEKTAGRFWDYNGEEKPW